MPDQMQTDPAEVVCVLLYLVVHLSSASADAKQLPFFSKDSPTNCKQNDCKMA